MALLLIVDDDPALLGVLRRRFSKSFDVIGAQRAAEGLRLAFSRTVDLILTDLKLPDMSGVDMIRELRRHDLYIPAVIITAYGTIRTAVEAMQLGATDYLEKPVDTDTILKCLRSALALAMQRSSGPRDSVSPIRSNCRRWADAVWRAANAPSDTRNLEDWSRIINVSPATLKHWCYGVNTSAKASINFLRVLRALIQMHQTTLNAAELIDADPRTVTRLVVAAGFHSLPHRREQGTTIEQFLSRQRFVSDTRLLTAVRDLLHRERM